jgi:hypothetical protein
MVTVAPTVVRRRAYSVPELARRWHTTETRALEFLQGFQAAGFAVESGGYWRASAKARALHLVDRDGVPL